MPLTSSPERMAPTARRPLLTKTDQWLLGVGLIIGLLLSGLLLTGREGGHEVLIEARGELYVRAYLDTPARYAVPGPLGATVVEVREGAVRVVSSPCPEKQCVRSGPVHRRGGLIVCVPNRVANADRKVSS